MASSPTKQLNHTVTQHTVYTYLPLPSTDGEDASLTNSELLTMYSTGSEEQPRGEGEVQVHVGGEGESLSQCTSNDEVAQTQSGAKLTTLSRCTASMKAHCIVNWLDTVPYDSCSVSHSVWWLCCRFFKAAETAATGEGSDEITPANSQPSLLKRLMGRRELQFSGQQGLGEDGRGQQGFGERGFTVSKNLVELFADKEETEVSTAQECATAGDCCQGVATEEQRGREVDDHGEGSKAGCHPAQQHPKCPVGESGSSEGALNTSSTSIVEESEAPSPSFGPPAKKVRKSLQGFLFTSQTSDTVTGEGDSTAKRFMQPEDFLSSGIGYLTDLQRVPFGENARAVSPPKSLPTQEHHSCMHALPPENQPSTIDLTAESHTAETPTVRRHCVESNRV